jgi:hypothetical protein
MTNGITESDTLVVSISFCEKTAGQICLAQMYTMVAGIVRWAHGARRRRACSEYHRVAVPRR